MTRLTPARPLEVELGTLAALAGLPAMGPRRLLALLQGRSPSAAWSVATGGRPEALLSVLGTEEALASLAAAWAAAGRGVDPAAVAAAHRAAGVAVRPHPGVVLPPGTEEPATAAQGDPDGELGKDRRVVDHRYPCVLTEDPEPPAVLFTTGRIAALDGPRAAIVGTRRCTGTGAGMARELGRELSASGVHVVSGLALGIDGAAHRGALDALASHPEAARPVAVVGSGLDVTYPARHRDLWAAVAAEGLVVSEAPLGVRPVGWRFPARNRVIAGLADVVVVVESHAAGGSMHTVHEAIRRDIDVMAVPGSVRSPAAAGTNQLLAEGCAPVRDVGDVLVALGLQRGRRRRSVDHRPAPAAGAAAVLDAFDWEPATFEHLAVRTGMGLADLALCLEQLVADGWVSADGGWYERRATA